MPQKMVKRMGDKNGKNYYADGKTGKLSDDTYRKQNYCQDDPHSRDRCIALLQEGSHVLPLPLLNQDIAQAAIQLTISRPQTIPA